MLSLAAQGSDTLPGARPTVPTFASLLKIQPSGIIGAGPSLQQALPSPATGMPPPCSTSKPLRQGSGIEAAMAAAALDEQVQAQPCAQQEWQQQMQGVGAATAAVGIAPQPGVSAATTGRPGLPAAGLISPGWMTPRDVPNIRAFGPSPYSTAPGVTNSQTSGMPQGSVRSTGEREWKHL
jgi:hypothetical protein